MIAGDRPHGPSRQRFQLRHPTPTAFLKLDEHQGAGPEKERPVEIRRSELSTSRSYCFRSLDRQDWTALKAFFLSLDFDQRRSYFGGGLSDQAIAEFCDSIDWDHTTIVARSTSHCLEALALIAYIPAACETAELSMLCPPCCDRSTTVGNLFDLARATVSSRCELIIHRELALPELLHLVHERRIGAFAADEVRIRPRLTQKMSVAGSLS
jgi:hypothetical protein